MTAIILQVFAPSGMAQPDQARSNRTLNVQFDRFAAEEPASRRSPSAICCRLLGKHATCGVAHKMLSLRSSESSGRKIRFSKP